MVFDLSILIVHKDNPTRNVMLSALKMELEKQIRDSGVEGRVEVLVNNNEESIGAKSNHLLDICWGKYCARFDSDDMPGPNYIKRIFEGIDKDVDCCSLRGIITFDGNNPEVFEHSIKYKEWATTSNPIKYERYPNHLNAIKSSIAKQFKYPDISHGEDHDWSKQVFESGLIKTEYYIDEVIYNYKFVTTKNY